MAAGLLAPPWRGRATTSGERHRGRPSASAGQLAAAARQTATAGVDMIKLGFLAGADHRSLARELAPLAGDGLRLVAVLMADQDPDLGLPAILTEAGFFGVMLDTADKKAGSLRKHLGEPQFAEFVRTARRLGLFCGLAGSLGLEDIALLAALRPDYLGFRGALCAGDRADALDFGRGRGVREAIDTARALPPRRSNPIRRPQRLDCGRVVCFAENGRACHQHDAPASMASAPVSAVMPPSTWIRMLARRHGAQTPDLL